MCAIDQRQLASAPIHRRGIFCKSA